MCGIIFANSKKGRSAVKPLLKRFRNQEGRGTEGFGYVSIALDGSVSEIIRATEEKEMIAALNNENSSAILMHHRSPTSLPNYEGATHPFMIKHESFKYDYIIVHNGVIRNYELMFEDFKKEGFKFLSEMRETKVHEFVNTKEWYEFDDKTTINDSEAFAVDLAKNLENKSTYIRSVGTISFIALQVDKKENKVVNLIWGHNEGNPLVLEEDKALFCLKSVGHGKPIKAGTFFTKNWATGKITEKEVSSLSYPAAKRETKPMGFNKGGQRSIPDVPPRNITSTADEPIEDAIARMLPSPRHASEHENPEKDRERSLGKDDERMFNDFGQEAYESDLPVIQMEDLGFPDEEMEQEIAAADASGNGEGEIIRQLRNDLQECVDEENDAIDEINEAKLLLRIAADSKQPLSELEHAKGLLNIAEDLYKEKKRERQATEAELGAYVGVNAWTGRGAGSEEDGNAWNH